MLPVSTSDPNTPASNNTPRVPFKKRNSPPPPSGNISGGAPTFKPKHFLPSNPSPSHPSQKQAQPSTSPVFAPRSPRPPTAPLPPGVPYRAPQRVAAPPPPPPPPPAALKAKKKRRVRTKQCAKCMMPCVLLTRAKLNRSSMWYLVCDFCWPTYCDNNKDYVYGGTWINGRIVDQVELQQANGGGTKKPTPHHIHGPHIVRNREEQMGEDDDDDLDEDFKDEAEIKKEPPRVPVAKVVKPTTL